MKLKEGTVSVLVGCHSPIHSILVVFAWRILYGKYPDIWQIVCIFLHDIGHIGLDYLSNYEEKKEHWLYGAAVANHYFGSRGFRLCAGHCSHSGFKQSALYKADKYSWHIAPVWWLYLNTIFEPKLRMGYGRMEAVRLFKAQVKKSVESGKFASTHGMFLSRCKNGGNYENR